MAKRPKFGCTKCALQAQVTRKLDKLARQKTVSVVKWDRLIDLAERIDKLGCSGDCAGAS